MRDSLSISHLRTLAFGAVLIALATTAHGASAHPRQLTSTQGSSVTSDWLARWERNIEAESKDRYCDKETGEEIGWLVSPFLNGYYYGYLATHDTKWIDRLIDWSDSWMKRGVREPDGYTGWPKDDGASTPVVPGMTTDNILGEAMGLRPAVLMARVILKDPVLRARYGAKAHDYLQLSEKTFEKWDRRGCWRTVHNGGVWVVPEFGIDKATGQWTAGYARRNTEGFTLPDNKQNMVALWLIAMYDATAKPIYRDRAEQWWRVMKSRMKLRESGKYYEWDYWDPAGPWDYKPDGSTRHWVGVHPNGGYYDIDVDAIVTAYEHGLVFTKTEIERLIATNRDFMWNHKVTGAAFQRMDGGPVDDRWKNGPGVLWHALIPYDNALRQVFEANFNPAGWGGLAETPWYLSTSPHKAASAPRNHHPVS